MVFEYSLCVTCCCSLCLFRATSLRLPQTNTIHCIYTTDAIQRATIHILPSFHRSCPPPKARLHITKPKSTVLVCISVAGLSRERSQVYVKTIHGQPRLEVVYKCLILPRLVLEGDAVTTERKAVVGSAVVIGRRSSCCGGG